MSMCNLINVMMMMTIVYQVVLLVICCLTAINGRPSDVSKIIGPGRSTARKGEFPYLAVILEKSPQKIVTVGVLVAPDVVLTGGWNYYVLKIYDPSELVVLLGAHDRSKEEGPQQRIDVEEVVVHPELIATYEDEGLADVALIKLVKSARITKRVQVFPMTDINNDRKDDNKLAETGDCVSCGYGQIKYNEYETVLPRKLQKYNPEMRRVKECTNYVASTFDVEYQKNAYTCSINADFTEAKWFDGGNPLLCSLDGGDVKLYGIVTIIDASYEPTGFTAYTKLSTYLPWIVETAANLTDT